MKTKYFSWKNGDFAKGCKQCVRGEKLVLFITGICIRKCYFCPLSDKKYGKDVIFANERPIVNIKQAIEEAKLCNSKGAGITGGDPLCKTARTVKFIKALKKQFGKKFHIHLYTSFDLINKKNMSQLYKSGLDEIRIHARVDDDKLWNKIELIKKYNWDIGIEIPIIPGMLKQTKNLIDFFHDKIDFLNLNELEVADNKMSKLSKLGFNVKKVESYAVKGSQELALKLLRHASKYKLNVHYCTAKLKDKVQMGKRISKRAKNIKKRYDVMTDEGTLIRGVIYGKDLSKIRKDLMKEFDIPKELIEIEDKRILTGAWIIRELKHKLKAKKLKIAVVEEYPTWDKFQITKEEF